MKNNWIIEEKEFTAETAMAYEGLFTLGSGYLHTRGSLEEYVGNAPQNITNPRPAFANASSFRHGGVQLSKWGSYVPGVFAHHPNLNEEMVNLPYFLGIEPWVAGEKLDVLSSEISDYSRQLNLKSASLERMLVWQTPEGPLEVQFERFISGKRTQLSVQRATFTAQDKEIHLSVKAGIDADIRTNGCDHFISTKVSHTENRVKAIVATNENSFYDNEGQVTNVSGGDQITTVTQILPSAGELTYEAEARRGFFLLDVTIPAGSQLVLEKRTAVATSRDLPTFKTADEVLNDAATISYDALFDEHQAAWAQRWAQSDVQIESKDKTDKSQLALRTSIFHLLRSHTADDPRVAIDAKGAAGDIYYGRYFWDTEIYLLPFFLYTDPERARTLVDFRNETLSGAKRNAARGGYRGARYPWESDNQGNDCCPPGNWQYKDHEIHISADIAYAFAHYAANTSDNYLKNARSAETLLEIARYWTGRVDWQDGIPHLLGVMGPDEYTALISDNAYTNYMVKFALNLAADHCEAAAGASPEEIAQFREIAQKLPILREENQVILQCKEFDGLAEPQFDKFWKGYAEGKPIGHFAEYVPQERLYRSKCLKQADVLMLAFLFYNKFSPEEIEKTWEKYLPYTTHDSSLSLGVHALLANRIGKKDTFWEMSQKCMFSDLDVAGEGAAEGVHIANCGMNWQLVVFGAAGILNALQSENFTMTPQLPEQWTKVSFPFVWKNQPLYIEVGQSQVTVENCSQSELKVTVAAESWTIPAGAKERFKL
jgi:kojibiose phosphorylase